MKIKMNIVVGFILILALAFPSIASAKPSSFEACTGDSTSGIVVAVDEITGEITIYTDSGTFCSIVKRRESYDHPVIDILGQFFEKVSLEDLSENLTTLQTWVVFNTTWELAEENDTGVVSSQVIKVTDNGGGSYTITLLVEGETELQTITFSDEELYQTFLEGLLNNTVSFDLITDETGNVFVSDGADQIGAYHDDGMGLGVLVKLFAMADAYGVPVDELVTRFKNGEGLGQMFKDESLGKPDLLGTGHVFKGLGKNPGHPDGKDKSNKSDKSEKEKKDK